MTLNIRSLEIIYYYCDYYNYINYDDNYIIFMLDVWISLADLYHLCFFSFCSHQQIIWPHQHFSLTQSELKVSPFPFLSVFSNGSSFLSFQSVDRQVKC